MLARLEDRLLARATGFSNCAWWGRARKRNWLRDHLKHAEFTGLLTGRELSRAFANLDLLAFPSETDTFGLVVLEAFASGVPAMVTGGGGPKFTVRHGHTGYVAYTLDEFASYTSLLMSRPDLLSAMRRSGARTSRDHFLGTHLSTACTRPTKAACSRPPWQRSCFRYGYNLTEIHAPVTLRRDSLAGNRNLIGSEGLFMKIGDCALDVPDALP